MNMEFLSFSSVLFTISLLLLLLSFIVTHVFRSNKDDSLKKDADKILMKDGSRSNIRNCDTIEDKEESSAFTFKFQYQLSNKLDTKGENQLPVATSIHKYQFIADKDVSGFVKDPEIQVFHLEESYLESAISYSDETENKYSQLDTSASPHKDLRIGALSDVVIENGNQQPLTIHSNRLRCENLEEPACMKDIFANSLEEIKRRNVAMFLTNEFSSLNSDSDSVSVSDGYSVKDLLIDSDGILSDKDVDEFEHQSVTSEESTTSSTYKLDLQEHRDPEEAKQQYFYDSDTEYSGSRDRFINWNSGTEQKELIQRESGSSRIQNPGEEQAQDSNPISIELIDSCDNELLPTTQEQFSTRENSETIISEEVIDQQNRKELSVRNEEQITSEKAEFSEITTSEQLNTNLKKHSVQLQRNLDGHEPQLDETKETTKMRNETSKKNHLKKISDDDDDDLDSLLEHDDIIEQLKMEIRRTRTNGLSTILEESESPKSVEDLKPWKIDKKFPRDDPIDELHKFYKSYIERMRKLDILNYQKMYAIGFHQLKDPLELLGSQMFCIPTITSIMSQNCPLRRGSSTAPSENFIKELRCDLELVYVAQMCISWEFLRWQFEKIRELPESGSRRNHHYNQVAGEFQKFQVVIQRFVENETFQGPRLQNYVKNRIILRNLLQVPVVKEDSFKGKKEEQQKDNFIITIEILEDIMEESIRIFWEFVKTDKDETPLFLKGLIRSSTELRDPSDYELLTDIKSDLQKKEKKLCDILRTGNCLIKKFKKPKEDRSNIDIFFSQIDLKLIARVLRMPRITSEQLVWCQNKLSKIIIAERKIHREASFFLFPS